MQTHAVDGRGFVVNLGKLCYILLVSNVNKKVKNEREMVTQVPVKL